MSIEIARRLRRDITDAERVMWRQLRSRQLAGYKFRRQQPIDHYIVDFICFSHRFIIEIDGGQHADPTPYEEERTRYLERHGFRIARFWNNEVFGNAEGVCATILHLLHTPHLPAATRRAPPSPARGEG